VDLGIKGRRAISLRIEQGLGARLRMALANEGVHVTLTGARRGRAEKDRR